MKISTLKIQDKKQIREQIMQSTLASFQIEGIIISREKALAALKNVEFSLKK